MPQREVGFYGIHLLFCKNVKTMQKLLYLYAFYHYYFGDDDRLDDIIEHCNYTKEFDNFAQGFFE